MKKTTNKSGVTVEVPDNTTLVMGTYNSNGSAVQISGSRAVSLILICDLLVGALGGMDDRERTAALSCLRDVLSEKGILGENVKMKVFYKDWEVPDDPIKAMQKSLDELQERLRKRVAERG
ncbi:MAG: hypothetical protein IJ858_06660 [Acidaminococcaceae bacterium]|nr:hypothetical protein [Acidaminococcaceae bacterium]MBR2183087.1 hypothetical protein [Acidaminococcaceae bacterium]